MTAFKAWLDKAEAADPKRYTVEKPPSHLLFNDLYATEIGYGDDIVQRRFDRKYDMGFEVCRATGKSNVRTLMANANAWAWLSLFFHESTIPFKTGKWFTGARSRHLVEKIEGRRYDQSHRHLVKGATTNVSRFGEFATVLMTDASGMSKIEEQVMSRKVDPPLAFLPELIKALHAIYWDADADDVRSGASGDGNGSIMQFEDLIGQFDLTYDISHLKSEHLVSMLPKAFSRFQAGSSRRTVRRRVRGVQTEVLEAGSEAQP